MNKQIKARLNQSVFVLVTLASVIIAVMQIASTFRLGITGTWAFVANVYFSCFWIAASVTFWKDKRFLKEDIISVIVITFVTMGSIAGTLGSERCAIFASWANTFLAVVFIYVIVRSTLEKWRRNSL